jgi:hypothetical protein
VVGPAPGAPARYRYTRVNANVTGIPLMFPLSARLLPLIE